MLCAAYALLELDVAAPRSGYKGEANRRQAQDDSITQNLPQHINPGLHFRVDPQ